MRDLKAIVVDNQLISEEILKLKVYLPETLELQPGNFAMLKIAVKDVFLRRPFSFADYNPNTGKVTFYIKIAGKGSKALLQLNPGQEISMLLPLGRSFTLRPGKSLLVAGGIGIAPLNFLARRLREEGGDIKIIYGIKNNHQLINEVLSEFPDKVEVYNEAGGLGIHGLITAGLLKEEFSDYDQIYVCGPTGMLKAIKPIIEEFSGPIEVSLESYMACGFGACQGCVVKIRNNDEIIYKKVCQDGPVFSFKDVVL